MAPKKFDNPKEISNGQELIDAMGGQDVDHIGHLVYTSYRKASAERATINQELIDAGLAKHTPPKLSNDALMTRGTRLTSVREKVTFKKVKTTKSWVTWRATKDHVLEDATATKQAHRPTVKVETLPAMAMNRETGELTSQDDTHDVYLTLQSAVSALKELYITEDLRKIFQSVLEELNAIPVRDTGGIYFVPKQSGSRGTLEALQKIIESCGDSKLYLIPMPRHHEAFRSCQDGAKASLAGEFANIIKSCQAYVSKLGDVDSNLTQERALKARLKEANSLRDKLNLFKSSLGLQMGDLEQALEMMKQATFEVIDTNTKLRALQKQTKSGSILHRTNAASEIEKVRKEASAKAQELLDKARDGKLAEHTTKVDDEFDLDLDF